MRISDWSSDVCSSDLDHTKFHHGGPFRNAVLDGVLDPTRTIQIGIRGSAEYPWEFSFDSGMTVIHAEEVPALGIAKVVEKALAVGGYGPPCGSFGIEGIVQAFTTGTGPPEGGGLPPPAGRRTRRGLQG